MQLAKGEFGGRVGIWRLIELFDRHADWRGNDLSPRAGSGELYPDSLRAVHASGHEIADHMWGTSRAARHATGAGSSCAKPATLTIVTGRRLYGHAARPLAFVAIARKASVYTSHECARPFAVLSARRRWRATRCSICCFITPSTMRCSTVSPVARIGQSRAADHRHGPRVRSGGGKSSCNNTMPAGCSNVCLHPFVSGPRAADRDAGPVDHSHEGDAGRLSCSTL